jgi:putative nucleotidyltransferase with HDIG domain
MSPVKLNRRTFAAVEIALLAGTLACAVWLSRSDEWHPLPLLLLLFVLALGGEWFTVEHVSGVVSASLAVMTLAMGLLGPAPAAICGVAAIALHSLIAGRTPREWLNNVAGLGVAAFVAGLVVRAVAGDVAVMHGQDAAHSILFGLVLLGAEVVLLTVNFVVFALELKVEEGRSLTRAARELLGPTLPGELAVGVIAIALVLGYRNVGLPVLLAAIPVLVIFQQLGAALVRSERRAEQLDARTRQLATFQWAVPSTFMEGLGLRDPTAMRHGAAVASYAKAVAVELGCAEDEQDVIHLAALLHDIGKFTWSDRVLHPGGERLTDDDQALIRRHPQDGSMMLGKFDGFGPVADAILYHHERVDGGGYPTGLIGSEIPLASRIIAVCSTYDAMTKRETFGPPMSAEEAVAELRAVSGSQLDGEIVEAFAAVLQHKGPTFGQDADYRTELEFDNRVRKLAQPKGTTGTPARRTPVAMRLRRRH